MKYSEYRSGNRRLLAAALRVLLDLPLALALDAQEISGIVIDDQSGEPLASARIKVIHPGEPTLAADLNSGRDGRFQSPRLLEAPYLLDISKANYLGAIVPATATVRGIASAPIVVRLVKLGAVSGQVLDGRNMPIERAWVFPMIRTAPGGPLHPLKPVLTDREGKYRLHGLAPGRYAIAVTRAAFRGGGGAGAKLYPDAGEPRMFSVSGGEDFRNVDFSFFETVAFHVSGLIEPAASGKRYAVSLAAVDWPGLSTAVTQSGADGRFSFARIPPGSYHLLVSGPVRGHRAREAILEDQPSFGRTRIEVAGQDLDNVTVEIGEGRSTGFVFGAESAEPLPSGCPPTASIVLTPLESWGSWIERRIEVGFVTPQIAANLAPGRYSVNATGLDNNCFSHSKVVDLSETFEQEPVVIPLNPAGGIHGRIIRTDDDLSYSVVLLAADPSNETLPLRLAYPDKDASFVFDGLRPGRYRSAASEVSATTDARWIPGLSEMFEIDVLGGTLAEVELPVRRSQK